ALTDGDTTYNYKRKPISYAYWQGISRPELLVDFGKVFHVERVAVHLLSHNEGPHGTSDVDVFVTGDPLEFPDVLKVSRIAPAQNGWNEMPVNRADDGLRLVFHRAAGKSYVTLSEIAVWGREASKEQAAQAVSVRATSPRRERDGIAWWAFDFGPADSPSFAQFHVADSRCAYSKERGFGWIPQRAGKDVPGLSDRDRGETLKGEGAGISENSLFRDFVTACEYYHPQVRQTFALDVPNGDYRVMTFHGDTRFGRPGKQAFWIEAQGRVVAPEIRFPVSLMTNAVFNVTVNDGQLKLTFDAQASDPAQRGFVLNGLAVIPAGTERERTFAGRKTQAILAAIEEERRARFAALFKEVPYAETNTMVAVTAADRDRGFVAWTPNWMELIYTNSVPTAAAVARPCATFATPGEYEPVAVALRSLRPLKGARVEVGNLAGPGGQSIPAAAVEARAVRCWAQRLGSSWSHDYRVMPELLEKLPAVDVPAGFTKEFWLTIHVPPRAQTGEYRGPRRLVTADGERWETPRRLEVLPFTLAPTERVVGMYWHDQAGEPELLDRQVRDMVEHGMRAVTISRSPKVSNVDGKLVVDANELLAFLQRLRRLGLTGPIPYNNSFEGLLQRAFPQGDFDRLYVELIRELKQVSNQPDALKLLYYPVDEIGNADERGRRAHDLCALIAKVPGATSYITVNNYAAGEKWGDTFDIWCGNIEYTVEQERRLLARGKRYLRYGSAYLNDCRKARNSCGFGFYRRPAEAMYYWHYQYPVGDPFNDFDGNARDWCAAYPGPDGTPIPTMDWESLREGVDDLRYITTLKQLAARAGKGNAAQKQAAAKARAELATVLATDEETKVNQYNFAESLGHDDYNALRRRLADRIAEMVTALGEKPR
ncbi:MAG: DUF4091 domain-containing protein, partial [Verrucomicrobia bacterium]|nr:DUF4091 domain-containing protein [Verrucomicrobiota bacterium]